MSVEHAGRRACHANWLARPTPAYHKRSPGEFNRYPLCKQALDPPDGDRSAGAGSTGGRFTSAPLKDAQPYMRRIDHLHEAHVDPPGKACMPFNERTEPRHPRTVEPGLQGPGFQQIGGGAGVHDS